ncbi:MAG: 16S rRNA (adenine(1518)-N(6)/adenine(1519)-N(6))-dimethyltransferase RsmA [Bacteroidia bacterium]|nr:16S rRNA (adenine(1518)-N(6)/adenine(1519)-N(6))-dimethyltransferase RsmA [Bacteroidia bacterium]
MNFSRSHNAYVRPKKHLGQHFLTDLRIAEKIVKSLPEVPELPVVEVGPGKGILTRFLLERKNFLAFDVDEESVDFLWREYPQHKEKIILGDFLKTKPEELFDGKEFWIIGNFPYHLSGELMEYFFRNRQQVMGVVGMFQKEVAERVCASPKSKAYGIFSVLLQTFFRAEYLFTVKEGSFHPPPKVKSGVIRLERFRKTVERLNEELWENLVRTAFRQRRKMLGNSLKNLINDLDDIKGNSLFTKRPEELNTEEFISISKYFDGKI